MPKTATIEDVLHFWFEEITPEHWFKKDDAFDDSIRTRFEPTIVAALSARLDSWAQESRRADRAATMVGSNRVRMESSNASSFLNQCSGVISSNQKCRTSSMVAVFGIMPPPRDGFRSEYFTRIHQIFRIDRCFDGMHHGKHLWPEVLAVMHAIKASVDPKNLMNPGKIL